MENTSNTDNTSPDQAIKNGLEGLRTFNPTGTTQNGNSKYSVKDKAQIVAQLDALKNTGKYTIAKAKEELSKLHNVNASTIESWRKTQSNTKDNNVKSGSVDYQHFKHIEDMLKSIDSEFQDKLQEIKKAEEVLAIKDSILEEIKNKKELIMSPLYKKMKNEKEDAKVKRERKKAKKNK